MRYLYIAILLIISTTIQAQVCIVVDGYTPAIVAGKKVLEICPGTTISMTAVDDCYYPGSPISTIPTWTLPGNVNLPPNFNNISTSEAGIYSVYTSSGYQDQIEIKHKPIENLNVSHPRLNNTINILTFCENEIITITNASSFSNITWSLNQTNVLGSGSQINLQRSDLATGGEMFVTATYNSNGCTARDTFNIIMLQIPEVDLGSDTFFCQGAPTTLVLKNTIANYGYPIAQKPAGKWFKPGQTFAVPGIQLIVNTPGVYIHEVASPIVATCLVRDTIEILEKTAPVINPIDDISICANSGVTLNASIQGATNTNDYDFKWRLTGKGLLNTTSQPTITNTPETNNSEYTVRVTDKVGCFSEEIVVVSWYPNQVMAKVDFADTSACGTTPVVLGAEGTSGYAPYSYKWFPTTNMTGSTSENPSVIPISQDTITYSVVVSDDKGCKDTAYVTVLTPDMRIDIKEGPVLSTCKNDPLTLNSVITGGQAPYSIKWLNSSNIVLKDTPGQMGLESQLPFPLPKGINMHTVRVEVVDVRGCPEFDQITINVVTAPTISYSNNMLTVCAGSPIKFPPPSLIGGSGNSVFTWIGPNLSDNSATPTYTPSASDQGLKTFSVKISDTQISCPGNSAPITVNVIPTPQVSFAKPDTTICLGTDAVLTPQVSKSVLNFTWKDEDGQTLYNDLSYTTQEKGIYKIIVTDPAAGCFAEATKTVFAIKPGSYANILADTAVFNDIPLILTSLNDGVNPVYTWKSSGLGQFEDNGFAEAIYKPSAADSGLVTFTLEVNTKCGTEALIDTFTVFFNKKEKPKENLVYIPNAFAPSDLNPKNQTLMIFSQNLAEDNFQFIVFNRWGEKVFETTDATLASQKGWNGSINNNGSTLKTDVYTYTVKGEFTDGKTFERTGTATLLR